VPIAANGRLQGRITQGMRRNDATYEPEAARALTGVAEVVARALWASTKFPLTAARISGKLRPD
jgi:hypothetical protein